MKKILLFVSLLAALWSLPAQTPNSCDFTMWAWQQPGGGAYVYPEIYGEDTLDIASVLWNTGQTTQSIFVNNPGTYCVTVTFDDGCSSSNCIVWSGNQQPTCEANIYEDSTSTTLVASMQNGQWPFTYLWSTGATTQFIQSGGPGINYCVTVTDALGCSSTDCTQSQGGNCQASVSTNVDVGTNSVTLTAMANAVPPFSYLWNTGETTQAITFPFTNDTFSVTITDATGCTSVGYGAVNLTNCSVSLVQSGANLNANFSGTGAATYVWSNGQTGSSISPGVSGTYCVTATSVFGCTATSCKFFNGTPPPGCQMSAEILPDPSSGFFNLVAIPKNGTAPFTYKWKYGPNGQYSPSVQTVNYGGDYYFPYKVTITDASGCTASATFSDSTCLLALNYFVPLDIPDHYRVNISNQGVEYVWFNTTTGAVGGGSPGGLNGVLAPEPGQYCVTLTDVKNCQQKACVELPECAVTLHQNPDSSITAATFGDQIIGITWSDPSLSGTTVMPPAGWTMLYATIETATCSATDTIHAADPAELPKFVFIQKALVQPDGARLIALCAQPEKVVEYLWSNGATTREIITSTPGNYCVTATYASGHQVTHCIELIAYDKIEVRIRFGIPAGSDQRFGDLWLIKYDPDQGGILTAIDTVPFNNGLGYFENVPPGNYLIKASVSDQSALYPNYIPTYWEREMLWSDARTLPYSHPFGMTTSTLFLIKGQNPGGPGFIGGLVSEGANLMAGGDTEFFFGGGGVPGVTILLTLADGTPVGHFVSDAQGQFRFPNLAFGVYKVWVDIPGLPVVFKEVTISPANPSVSNLSVLVDDDSANFVGTISTDELSNETALSISPNPAFDAVNLSFGDLENQAFRVAITNPLGQIFFEKTFENDPASPMRVEVGGWPTGNYFVHLELSDGRKMIGKLAVAKQ